MNRMTRIIVNDRLDQFRFEIDPTQVIDATSIEEVNGEHSVTITTLQELEKTDRLLIKDGMGRWHEYVVLGIEEKHAAGGAIQHEYYCVWSLQYDLSATFINDQFGCGVVPGHASIPQTPRRALECALEGTSRWAIGTITVTTQSSASFYRRSGWEGMQTVIERWGGSLRATITVGLDGAVTRAVDLLEHEGDATATRRFDYGFDVKSIKRTVSDDIWPCRIVPLGKSVETDAGGYTRRPSIESVNQGIPWLQDDAAVPLVRIPDGSGGWEYPTAIIKNDTYEDPADLLVWAQAHKSDYTRPIVSYEAEVAQFAQAGLDPHGVALGDEVIVVDRTFGEGGLRITARVIRIESSLLDPADVKLTIGNAQSTLAGQLADLATSVAAVTDQVATATQWQTSTGYLDALIGRLNDEINATGGYWYMVPGVGTRTYDVPVSDPAVGSEASQVVEVSGGTIRIANSRDAQGNWEWRTIIQSGLLVADTVKSLDVNTGYISSYDGSTYWNLDTGELVMRYLYSFFGNTTSPSSYDFVETTHGTVASEPNLSKRMNGLPLDSSSYTRYFAGLRVTNGHGNDTADPPVTRTDSAILIMPFYNWGYTYYGAAYALKNGWGAIASTGNLHVVANYNSEDATILRLHDSEAGLQSVTKVAGSVYETDTTNSELNLTKNQLRLRLYDPDTQSSYASSYGLIINKEQVGSGTLDAIGMFTPGVPVHFDHAESVSFGNNMALTPVTGNQSGASQGTVRISELNVGTKTDTSGGNGGASNGDIYARTLYVKNNGYIDSGSGVYRTFKSRLVETEDYGERLLYCYETPAPMFGDIGSGSIGPDGVAVISVDDVFAETARTDYAYQVFLQKCGDGDLWVADKRPTHFVVQGTPGLAFDWELKARQVGLETTRLEDYALVDLERRTGYESEDRATDGDAALLDDLLDSDAAAWDTEHAYDDPLDELERIYMDELLAA